MPTHLPHDILQSSALLASEFPIENLASKADEILAIQTTAQVSVVSTVPFLTLESLTTMSYVYALCP